MSNTYIGLTIGPIYKTLEKARSTRQFWVASYLFSWLVQEITHKLKGETFLVPFVENRVKDLPAGLFPDRFIYKGDPQKLEATQEVIDEILGTLANRMSTINRGILRPDKEAEILLFLQGYIQAYTVLVTVKEGDNPVLDVNDYLDTAELQPLYHARLKGGIDYIDELFAELKNWGRFSPDQLIRLVFKELSDIPAIKSLSEIASIDLESHPAYKEIVNQWKEEEKKNENNSRSLFEKISGNNALAKQLLTRHKYVAIVTADGDNIGATITALDKVTNGFQEFSKLLLDFGHSAVKKIQAYSGLPVYAGGDDLLFFAPVVYGEKSIFDLADELNGDFQDLFEEGIKKWKITDIKCPTLSFGISITFHKYPMSKAIQESGRLMFGVAKQNKYEIEGKNHEKNSIAFQILKHSGTKIDSVFGKETEFYHLFKELLKQKLDEGAKFLSSVSYKLSNPAVKALLIASMGDNETLTLFFEQSFDEKVHQTPANKAFFGKLVTLVAAAQKLYTDKEAALTHVYHILRTLNFLNKKDND